MTTERLKLSDIKKLFDENSIQLFEFALNENKLPEHPISEIEPALKLKLISSNTNDENLAILKKLYEFRKKFLMHYFNKNAYQDSFDKAQSEADKVGREALPESRKAPLAKINKEKSELYNIQTEQFEEFDALVQKNEALFTQVTRNLNNTYFSDFYESKIEKKKNDVFSAHKSQKARDNVFNPSTGRRVAQGFSLGILLVIDLLIAYFSSKQILEEAENTLNEKVKEIDEEIKLNLSTSIQQVFHECQQIRSLYSSSAKLTLFNNKTVNKNPNSNEIEMIQVTEMRI